MSELTVEMCSISVRREERRRVHEAEIASWWGARRWVLMSAKREGRGVASPPPREAKTEDISPSFRGPRSRGVRWAGAAVARVRDVRRRVRVEGVRRSVESMMAVAVDVRYQVKGEEGHE